MQLTPAQVMSKINRILNWMSNNGETWHAITPLNGWANLGGSNAVIRAEMANMPPNAVCLSGVLTTGSSLPSSRVFGILPYNPDFAQGFTVGTSGVSSTVTGLCDASGNLSVIGGALTANTPYLISGLIFLD